MIAPHHIPATADRPARDIWVALMFILELGTWRPLSTHDTPLEAGRACVRAFHHAWHDIHEQARKLLAFTQRPDVVAFASKSVDGQMLGSAALQVCSLLEAHEPSVLQLLNEPQPDDNLTIDDLFIDRTASHEMHGLDEHKQPVLSDLLLNILARIDESSESVVDMLSQVLETTPTELPVLLLTLSPQLAYPSRSLTNAWYKPLPAFMRTVYRLRASDAALDGQPVGSYLDFCARTIAESRDTQSIALRLLARCRPPEMSWPDYLSSLSDEPIEELDDHTIVHFGDHNTTVEVAPMSQVQNLARMIIEQQRQPDDYGPNRVVPLMFLEPRFAEAEGPLPQEIADDLFIRAVRGSVQRVHQHQETLISEAAIDRALSEARDVMRELAGSAGVVQEPIEDASTPVKPRGDSGTDVADVIPFTRDNQRGDVVHRDDLPDPDSAE